ncbi:MAG: hypothetical protein JWP15_3844, partial [Alphaproteobacteria bacterium]|nr:hypothetical protein [Alphaproteobacteria bacterium]
MNVLEHREQKRERWGAVRCAVRTGPGAKNSGASPADDAPCPQQWQPCGGRGAGNFDPLFEALLRQTREAVFLLDERGRLIEANRAGQQAFGGRLPEPGSDWAKLWPAATRDLAGDAVRRARSGVTARLSIHQPGAGGTGRWWDVLVAPVRAERQFGTMILATCRDTTVHRKSADDLLRAAERDPLTLLPNRLALQRRLEASIVRSMEGATPVGLILLDLDHFNQVNEALGTAAGDHLLRSVSARLKDMLKPSDCLARIGGDTFAIIFEGLKGIAELSIASECMLERVRLPTCHAGRLINVGASVGGSLYPRDGASGHDLLKSAECALQAVKAEGRGASRMFHQHMRVEAQRKASQRNLARVALLERSIVPVYQPKMDLRSGQIVGFEALLRWSHPRRGLQGPETLAEGFKEYQLASSLGRMMQQAVIADLQRWRKAGIDCRHISI